MGAGCPIAMNAAVPARRREGALGCRHARMVLQDGDDVEGINGPTGVAPSLSRPIGIPRSPDGRN
eukprot:7359609-Lingulodinium_polyedra.AAC.1